jgi:succinate dehydrogenase / fumarate reductase membrane anchor subunit
MSGHGRGSGARHFIRQRVTALLNIPLTLGLVTALPFVGAADYDAMRGFFGNPLVSVGAILLILSASIHMRLGMQTIIEDYIHGEARKKAALAANTIIAVAVAVAGLAAVLMLGFGA